MKRGNTLVGMLAVMAIIAVLAAVAYVGFGPGAGKSTRKDGKGITTLGAAKAKAQDEVCKSNLSQARQLLMVAQQTSDDALPQTLDQIPGIKSVSNCPIGKEAYTYDPSTGKISCPHPGHEAY